MLHVLTITAEETLALKNSNVIQQINRYIICQATQSSRGRLEKQKVNHLIFRLKSKHTLGFAESQKLHPPKTPSQLKGMKKRPYTPAD